MFVLGTRSSVLRHMHQVLKHWKYFLQMMLYLKCMKFLPLISRLISHLLLTSYWLECCQRMPLTKARPAAFVFIYVYTQRAVTCWEVQFCMDVCHVCYLGLPDRTNRPVYNWQQLAKSTELLGCDTRHARTCFICSKNQLQASLSAWGKAQLILLAEDRTENEVFMTHNNPETL